MSWWAWLNLAAGVAWAVWWLRGANQGFCLHDFFPGRNMKLRKLYRALGRIHKESEK